MRIIPLSGTKAGYERIKLLSEAENYGLHLAAEATAPFTVRWDPSVNAAAICLGRTRIAHVSALRAPELHIVDTYPAGHDRVLLRALRNATEVTDQLAKLMRAEKTTRGPLFSTTFEAFRVQMDIVQFKQAVLGAETLDARLRLGSSDRVANGVKITAYVGKAVHSFVFAPEGDGIVAVRGYGSAYAMKESAFIPLLEKGARVWNSRFSEDRLMAAVQAAPAIENVAVDEIAREHEILESLRQLSRPDAEAVVGALSLRAFAHNTDRRTRTDLRLNGLRIMTNSFQQKTIHIPQGLTPPDAARLRQAFKAMSVAWQANTLDGELSDFPKLRTDALEELITTTDFAYDM